ncbi:MAG: hypothetical protein GY795_39085 [Desulfobacterales bacterium]|nr:hypothetical protein [Desulfobacterales bacterium]
MKSKHMVYFSCLILVAAWFSGCITVEKPPVVERPDVSPYETRPVSHSKEKPELGPVLRLDTGGHTSMIGDLLVTSDKKYLISCSNDKTIRVWDTQTKKEVRKILGQIGEGSFGMIYAIALSPDDEYLAVGGYLDKDISYRYAIRIYNFQTGNLIRILKSHSNVVADLSFSPDGKYLVSGSSDYTVKVWDVFHDFTLVHTFEEHQDSVYAVKMFKYGNDYRIVSAGYDNQIFLYSLNQKKKLAWFSHKDKTDSLAVSRQYIAGAGYDNIINIFDLNLKHRKAIESETRPTGMCFSPDGKLLLAGTGDHPLNCNIYDTSQNFKKIQSFKQHDNLTQTVAFFDNQAAVTGGGNNFDIYFWNPITGQEKGHIAGESKMVWAVGISGDEIAFGNTFDYQNHNNRGKLEKVFDLKRFEIPSDPFKKGRNFKRISTRFNDYSLSHAKGGDYSYNDAVLEIEKSGKIIHRIVRDATNGLGHSSYGFTQDGVIVSGGSNGHLKAYNTEGEQIADFVGHTGQVWSIATQNHWLVSGGSDQIIMLWDLRELQKGNTRILPNLQIFVSNDNEWVVWTKEGFFNASSNGSKYVGYHINQGSEKEAEYIGVEQMYDLFFRPDLIAKRYQGGFEDEIQDELAKMGNIENVIRTGVPPVLKLVSQPHTKHNSRNFTLELQAENRGGGIGKLVYRVNDVQVESPAGNRYPSDVLGTRKTFKIPLTLKNGKNLITVSAFDKKDKIESRPVTVSVEVDDPMERPPSLYLLAVGITSYKDRALKLKFAHLDAKSLARELETRGRPLFETINIKRLLNRQATAKAIEAAFEDLSEKINVNDVFVLYLAGHGMGISGRYHFIPWELPYENAQSLISGGISHDNFQDWLKKIKALKSLIILDTCNAGMFASNRITRGQTGGMADKTAIAHFMKATGRATLAATSEMAQALEGHKGHGVFTYVLLEGLKSEADSNGDNIVTVDELAKYASEEVPKITYKKWQYKQIPMSDLQGSPYFPIGCREGHEGKGCRKLK